MRKALPVLIGFLLGIFVITVGSMSGCGGGGGSGSGGGPGGGGGVSLSPSTLTAGPNGNVLLFASSGGVGVDVTWSSTDGFVTPTGVGTATYTMPASGTAQVTATRTAGGASDTSTFTVNPAMATIRGRVIDDLTFSGISGVIVDFYQGTTLLNSVTTMANGQFSSGVLPSATRFHLRNSSIPSSFYRQYTYDTKRYTTAEVTCSAPLPALVAGTSSALVTNIVVNSRSSGAPPPPPPNGCQ